MSSSSSSSFIPIVDSNGNFVTNQNIKITDLVQENFFIVPSTLMNLESSSLVHVFHKSSYTNFNSSVYNVLLDDGISKIQPKYSNIDNTMTKTQFLADGSVEERVIRIGNFYYFHVSGDDFSVENSNGVYTPIYYYDSSFNGSDIATPLNGDYYSVEDIFDNGGRVVSNFSNSNTFKVFELKKKCQEMYNSQTNTFGFRFVFLKTLLTTYSQTYSGQVDFPGVTRISDNTFIPLKDIEIMWDKNNTKFYIVDPSASDPEKSFANGARNFLLLKQDDNTYKALQTNAKLLRSVLINNIDRLAIGTSPTDFDLTLNLAEENQSSVLIGGFSNIVVQYPEIKHTVISTEGLGVTLFWKKGLNSTHTRVQISTNVDFTNIIHDKVTLLKKISFLLSPNSTYHTRLVPLNVPTDTVINSKAVTSTFSMGDNVLESVFTKFDKRVTSLIPGNVLLNTDSDYYYDIINKTYWMKSTTTNYMFRIIINDSVKNYILRSDEVFSKSQLLNNLQLKIKNRGVSETDYCLANNLDTSRFIKL